MARRTTGRAYSAGRPGRSTRPTGQWYLHNFLPEQPDLNWWTDEVWDAFDEILRFWFDRGIAGFRIDVAHGIVNDKELRDDPPDPEAAGRLKPMYSMNRPETHEIFRRWRRICEDYDPPRLLSARPTSSTRS